jgi:hypothetical protein
VSCCFGQFNLMPLVEVCGRHVDVLRHVSAVLGVRGLHSDRQQTNKAPPRPQP